MSKKKYFDFLYCKGNFSLSSMIFGMKSDVPVLSLETGYLSFHLTVKPFSVTTVGPFPETLKALMEKLRAFTRAGFCVFSPEPSFIIFLIIFPKALNQLFAIKRLCGNKNLLVQKETTSPVLPINAALSEVVPISMQRTHSVII